MAYIPYILVGVSAGVLAGLFGVGGGLIIVPALVIFLGFSQISATGTSLVALLLPVGIAAVFNYYKAGKIDLTNIYGGLIISAGMFFGAYFGSKLALGMPEMILKRCFCIFLLAAATKIWITT